MHEAGGPGDDEGVAPWRQSTVQLLHVTKSNATDLLKTAMLLSSLDFGASFPLANAYVTLGRSDAAVTVARRVVGGTFCTGGDSSVRAACIFLLSQGGL